MAISTIALILKFSGQTMTHTLKIQIVMNWMWIFQEY